MAISPEKLVAVRLSRGLIPKVVEQHLVPLPRGPAALEWQSLSHALTQLLERLSPAPAAVTVIVSNSLVRYALVPWSQHLRAGDEELAFARHIFRDSFGDDAQGWALRLSPGAMGEPRVASAIDARLVDALKAAFRGTRLRLHSIQPYLMTAHNLCLKFKKQPDHLFLVAENRGYACGAFRDGLWSSVYSGVISEPLEEELPLIVDRVRLWSGLRGRISVYVYAPEHADLITNASGDWVLDAVQLQPRYRVSPVAALDYAVAMSGV
jgi:hypothetical protein